MKQELAIVILNWNGKLLLEQFLPTVILHSPKDSVYVIDNASTDESLTWLNQKYPEVETIELHKNLGYAGGYQEGLKKINTEYYCLLNSDIQVTEGWIMPILNLFKSDTTIAAIQPKILDHKKPSHFEYAGAGGGLIDNLGYPFCRGRIFESIEEDKGQYDDVTSIFWASGACIFLRSDDYWTVEGLDTEYFAHQEEIDLCWRLQNINKKIMYCGTSTVLHVGGASLAYENPKKIFLNFRNSLISILKNEPSPSVYYKVFFRLVLDGIAGLKFITDGKWKSLYAILNAHFSFYKMIPSTLNKRRKLPKIKVPVQTSSIIFDYYIRKIKTYQSKK